MSHALRADERTRPDTAPIGHHSHTANQLDSKITFDKHTIQRCGQDRLDHTVMLVSMFKTDFDHRTFREEVAFTTVNAVHRH